MINPFCHSINKEKNTKNQKDLCQKNPISHMEQKDGLFLRLCNYLCCFAFSSHPTKTTSNLDDDIPKIRVPTVQVVNGMEK